jgi:hypothetical protein
MIPYSYLSEIFDQTYHIITYAYLVEIMKNLRQ